MLSTNKTKDLTMKRDGTQKSCMQHRSIKSVLASLETAVDAADKKKMSPLHARDTNPRNALLIYGER
jgi:hypothetical protein